MKTGKPEIMRIHESLNIMGDLIDNARHDISISGVIDPVDLINPVSKLDPIVLAILLIGLSKLRLSYMEKLGKLDEFQVKYRPALRSSYREAIAQIDSLLDNINEYHGNVDRLSLSFSISSVERLNNSCQHP